MMALYKNTLLKKKKKKKEGGGFTLYIGLGNITRFSIFSNLINISKMAIKVTNIKLTSLANSLGMQRFM